MRASNIVGAGLGLIAPLIGSAAAQACCSTGLEVYEVRTIVRVDQTPVTIDAFFTANTDIVIDEDLTVSVTDAPTHLATQVIDFDTTSIVTVISFNVPDYRPCSGSGSTTWDGPSTVTVGTSVASSSAETSSGATSEASEPATSSEETSAGATSSGASSEPATSEPASTEAATTEAATSEAETTEAATSEPATTEAETEAETTAAATTEAETTEPATSEPATEVETTEAAITEAATSEAETTEPATSEPATEVETTEAAITEAATSEAETTEPATSEAETTEPATTEAATSEPATTEAATSEPATTEAATSEPATTDLEDLEAVTTGTGTTTVSSTAATSSCPVATGAASRACASALPEDCTSLADLGVLDATDLLDCTAALADLGLLATAPDLGLCLLPGNTGAQTSDCLLDAVSNICITVLPDTCVSLDAIATPDLSDVDQCLISLGLFLTPDVLSCLDLGTITTGSAIVDCLTDTLDLEPLDDACPAQAVVPVNENCLSVPATCLNLEGLTLLGDAVELAAEILSCAAAVTAGGLEDIPGALACVTSGAVGQGGSSILDCISNAVEDDCLEELPEECASLASLEGGALLTDIPQCTAALGAHLNAAAAYCLAGAFNNGQTVVDCLNNALFS